MKRFKGSPPILLILSESKSTLYEPILSGKVAFTWFNLKFPKRNDSILLRSPNTSQLIPIPKKSEKKRSRFFCFIMLIKKPKRITRTIINRKIALNCCTIIMSDAHTNQWFTISKTNEKNTTLSARNCFFLWSLYSQAFCIFVHSDFVVFKKRSS